MNYRILQLLIITIFLGPLTHAQDEIIEVWPDKIPQSIYTENYQEKPIMESGKLRSTSKVTNPELSVFIPEEQNGTAIIIFPGGGYGHLAIDKEGYKVAHWLNSLGIVAFVLKYRLPSDEIMENKNIGPLQDAQESIRLIRRKAKKWDIDPNKIGVIGFSAGGHLAASLATKFDYSTYPTSDTTTSARPDFSALIYPVISLKEDITHMGSRDNLLGKSPSIAEIKEFSNEMNVNSTTPPVFLVHATDDKAVPVENSIRYFLAAKSSKVPAEMHIYERGGHGFGLGNIATNTFWPKAFKAWLAIHNFHSIEFGLLHSSFRRKGQKDVENLLISVSTTINH